MADIAKEWASITETCFPKPSDLERFITNHLRHMVDAGAEAWVTLDLDITKTHETDPLFAELRPSMSGARLAAKLRPQDVSSISKVLALATTEEEEKSVFLECAICRSCLCSVAHLSLLLVLRRAFVALAWAPSRRALKSDRMVLTAFAQVESERKESEKRAHKKRMFEAEAANANKKQAVDLAVARLRVQGAANAAAGFQASYAGASTSASASHMET
jgi:hypothetical protein